MIGPCGLRKRKKEKTRMSRRKMDHNPKSIVPGFGGRCVVFSAGKCRKGCAEDRRQAAAHAVGRHSRSSDRRGRRNAVV